MPKSTAIPLQKAASARAIVSGSLPKADAKYVSRAMRAVGMTNRSEYVRRAVMAQARRDLGDEQEDA